MVQFVGYSLERRREIGRVGQLEISAAGLGGNFGEAGIRLVGLASAKAAPAESTAPATTVTAAATAAPAAAVPAARATSAGPAVVHAGEADGIHHDVLFLRALHHVFQRRA